MKRWLPWVMTALGLAGVIGGWTLYPSKDVDGNPCGIQVLYGEYIKGTGDLANGYACTDGTSTLYASLGLLVAGVILFLAGWMWAVPRIAPRITTSIRPMVLAVFVLIGLLMISTAGWFGWQQYDKHRQSNRLHAAEKDLAAMELPQSWTTVTRQNQCQPNPFVRCGHSQESRTQLLDELIGLLHGHDTSVCPRLRRFPCGITVSGEISGYPAVAYAQADVYFNGDKHPASAVRLALTGVNKPVYRDGSVIQILLVTPEG